MKKEIDDLIVAVAKCSDGQSENESSFLRTAIEEAASGALELGVEATSYLIQGMMGPAKAVGDQTAELAGAAVQTTMDSGSAACGAAAEMAVDVAVGTGELALETVGTVAGVVIEGIASAL